MEKVSIIIPNYNKSKYLAECLESAISQDYDNYEIIIVDDHSTDNSVEIIRSFMDRSDKIRLFINEENLGVSKSLNRAIMESTGEFISWLSSDDRYASNKLSVDVKYLKTDPDIGYVYSDCYFIDESGDITSYFYANDITDQKKTKFYRNVTNGISVMFRKSCLDKIGMFDESLGGKSGHCADGMMWHKMLFYYKSVYIPEALVYTRLHDESLGSTIGESFKKEVWDKYKEEMDKWIMDNNLS